MSYHILHVMDYGCRLVRERGLLVCKKDGGVLGKSRWRISAPSFF